MTTFEREMLLADVRDAERHNVLRTSEESREVRERGEDARRKLGADWTIEDEIKRKMTLRLVDEDGNQYRWKFYRDPRTPVYWVLVDHTGYVRNLERTYAESIPRVKIIAENHNFKFTHELS